jgi:hypothetical protein
MKILVLLAFLVAPAAICRAQGQYQPAYSDPLVNLSNDVAKISSSVNTLSKTLQAFVDKFEKVGGMSLTEKQQRLVLAILQQAQADLTTKLNDTRSKLAQNEMDSRPRNIDRSIAFEGTTETQELRENRAAKFAAERTTLTALAQQLEANLRDTTEGVRDAQTLVYRLRRQYLPQIEKELLEQ